MSSYMNASVIPFPSLFQRYMQMATFRKTHIHNVLDVNNFSLAHCNKPNHQFRILKNVPHRFG